MSQAAARAREAAAPATASWPSAEGFVEAVLGRYAGQSRTVVVTVPAPVASLEAAFALLDRAPTFLWHPPEGPGFAAGGVARSVSPAGEARGAQVRVQADAVGARLEAVYHPAVVPLRPRWFGGLSFASGAAADGPWQPFGDGQFVLPRWCYGREGDRAWLAFAADGETLGADGRRQATAELSTLLEALAARAGRRPEVLGDPAAPEHVEHLPRQAWDRAVDAIRDAITDGQVDKVVAARRSMVRAATSIDPAAVLTRLGQRYPGCTRFAVRMGDATFVGATPERLVLRAGRRVLTEAMAGSVPHGSAARLLESDKDRREHDLVVRILLERLGPYCRRVDRSPEPQVRELPNVVHLHTPVVGELIGRTHVLDLVDALHPTPAVGGVPVGAAVEWITSHEAHPRGWYSGPVGWFDADGDGEFVVALRSGLVRGDRAWAYAGAGIVEGSEPEAEYAETTLKLRPLLEALGDTGDIRWAGEGGP